MNRRVGVTFGLAEKVAAYERALREVGLEPVRIAAGDACSLDGLGGLLVSGGTDVNPKLYGQTPHPETDQPDEARDRMEQRLLKEALAADLPVLAICRGMQLFNVVHGGTLIQHLEGTEAHRVRPPAAEHHRPAHAVRVEAGTRLAGIVSETVIQVNSRHHQAVAETGSGLIVSARAQDGVIEALESPGKRFAIAVQWHPEDSVNSSDTDRRLFEAFARAVGGGVETGR